RRHARARPAARRRHGDRLLARGHARDRRAAARPRRLTSGNYGAGTGIPAVAARRGRGDAGSMTATTNTPPEPATESTEAWLLVVFALLIVVAVVAISLVIAVPTTVSLVAAIATVITFAIAVTYLLSRMIGPSED